MKKLCFALALSAVFACAETAGSSVFTADSGPLEVDAAPSTVADAPTFEDAVVPREDASASPVADGCGRGEHLLPGLTTWNDLDGRTALLQVPHSLVNTRATATSVRRPIWDSCWPPC
jgi:hypothetical protein